MASSLILTVTRQCNLRCSYCPTVKSGWPALSVDDVERALQLFTHRYGGGEVKLFGGEPLLAPQAVRAALESARHDPKIKRTYLSSNGVLLDEEWLAYLRNYPKAVLTLSLDGRAADNRRLRVAQPGVPDAYDKIVSLLPSLLTVPRVVITQTIAPALAGRALENFRHLRALGFWRFNFLPAYYVPWKASQLEELAQSFAGIEQEFRAAWEAGERLYLRNLFTWAPTPFFNTGIVVDADRRIHASNVGLSSDLAELLERTQLGNLDEPPELDALEQKAREIAGLLESVVPEGVLASTHAVDALLSRFCERLYPAYLALRRHGRPRGEREVA